MVMGESKDKVWLQTIVPTSLGFVLVNRTPAYWSFIWENPGASEDVSCEKERERVLRLLSLPLLALAYLVSLLLLYLRDSSLEEKKTTKTKSYEALRGTMPPQAKTLTLDGREPVSVSIALKPRPPTAAPGGAAFGDLVKAAARAERDLNVREALALYERALVANPSDRETMLQACKVRCDLGFLIFDVIHDGPMKQFFTCREEETEEVATALVRQALEGARQLTEQHEDDYKAFTLLALCIGRSILLESQNKAKVRMAGEMHDAAQRAVALNPKDDAAHFMLARWNNDIASLPRVLKTLVRFIYGSSLRGSFQNAVQSSLTAIELNPTNLVNKVELGRAYTGLGDLARAKAVYEDVLGLQVVDVNSALYKQIALDDIERMEQGKPVGSLARPWWAIGG